MTARTAVITKLRYRHRMEWLLQVVDEIDDAVWAVRHGLSGGSGSGGRLRPPVLIAALALLLPGCSSVPAAPHTAGPIERIAGVELILKRVDRGN